MEHSEKLYLRLQNYYTYFSAITLVLPSLPLTIVSVTFLLLASCCLFIPAFLNLDHFKMARFQLPEFPSQPCWGIEVHA